MLEYTGASSHSRSCGRNLYEQSYDNYNIEGGKPALKGWTQTGSSLDWTTTTPRQISRGKQRIIEVIWGCGTDVEIAESYRNQIK